MPKRHLLSIIYFGRAAAIVGLITLPQSTAAVLVFGAVTGLFWLSTVPPTSSFVALMFGTRWLAMRFGFAFFSHQVRDRGGQSGRSGRAGQRRPGYGDCRSVAGVDGGSNGHVGALCGRQRF
jgi:hypothetical protein